MLMHPQDLLMDLNLDLEQRSGTVPRRFMPEDNGIRCTDNQQIYYLWKWTDPQIIEYKSQNCKLFQNLKKI